MKIDNIKLIEILDSRGDPTIECYLYSGNYFGVASVPAGASVGSNEAFDLRDRDDLRYFGRGVKNVIVNFYLKYKDKIINKIFSQQEEFDYFLISLDDSPRKENLGGNVALSISLAFADLLSKYKNISLYESIYFDFFEDEEVTLPVPMMNLINGGKHASNNLEIQEFMIMPVGAESFSEAIRIGVEVFKVLKKDLLNKNLSTSVGDEGGFAPEFDSTYNALDIICDAVKKAGYELGKDVLLALDVAGNEIYKNNFYHLDDNLYTTNNLIDFYDNLIKKYPIFSIEDPFQEFDINGFTRMSKKLSNKLQIVGDDIFVTNKENLIMHKENPVANAILIKPNQIGTLTQSIEAIKYAKFLNYSYIISHRSGETEDIKISHLAVASNSTQIKTGSVCRTDRVAKYNELIRIENRDKNIKFAGKKILKKFLNYKENESK